MVAAEGASTGGGGAGCGVLEGREEERPPFDLVSVDSSGKVAVVRVCEGEQVCGVVRFGLGPVLEDWAADIVSERLESPANRN